MVVGLAHRGVEHLGEHSCRMMSVRRGMLDGMVDTMAWGLAEKLLLLFGRKAPRVVRRLSKIALHIDDLPSLDLPSLYWHTTL